MAATFDDIDVALAYAQTLRLPLLFKFIQTEGTGGRRLGHDAQMIVSEPIQLGFVRDQFHYYLNYYAPLGIVVSKP